MLYLWLKAIHLIFIICWFAGIFYLPRLFVYYALAEDESTRRHLRTMQHKLYHFMTPLAVLAIVPGVGLVALNAGYYLAQPWLQLKLVLVLLLVLYHWQCGRYVRAFAAGAPPRHDRYYRFFNEAPVLVLFAVVILAVIKPWSG